MYELIVQVLGHGAMLLLVGKGVAQVRTYRRVRRDVNRLVNGPEPKRTAAEIVARRRYERDVLRWGD